MLSTKIVTSTQIKTSARVLRRSSRGLSRSLSRQRSRSVSSIRCDTTLITKINFLTKQVMSEVLYCWTILDKIQATNQPPDNQACQVTSSHDQIINFQISNLLSTVIVQGSMSTKRAWARTGRSNQGVGFKNLHKGKEGEKKRDNYLVKYKKLAIRRLF